MSTVDPKPQAVQVRHMKDPLMHDEGEAPLDGSRHPTTYRADRGGDFAFGGRMIRPCPTCGEPVKAVKGCDAKGAYIVHACPECGNAVEALPAAGPDTPRPREAAR